MLSLFFNRSFVILGILSISGAACILSAFSATEPPKSYIDLNPVLLNPAQAPLTKSGMGILSNHERNYRENLTLSTAQKTGQKTGQKNDQKTDPKAAPNTATGKAQKRAAK